MPDSLQPHGLQHARLPGPSPTPRVCSSSCPLSRWCHPTISSSVAHFSFCLSQHQVFSNESALHIRWLKNWSFSFSISPSNECSGLISFRMDWWFPCCPRNSQASSPAPQLKSITSLALSLLSGPTLTSVHDYGKNHRFDPTRLCWQSDVSAF